MRRWHGTSLSENAATRRVKLLKRLALNIPRSTKLTIYTTFIRPILAYGSGFFNNCTSAMSDMIEAIQRQAALTITGAYTNTSHIHLLRDSRVSLLSHRRTFSKIILLYKMINSLTPSYLWDLLWPAEPIHYQTWNSNIRLLRQQNICSKSFIPRLEQPWLHDMRSYWPWSI